MIFVCASLSKLFTLLTWGVTAPTHVVRRIPLYGSRNAFLFLSGTRVPTRMKSRNITNVPLGFRRNPNRNRNPAPGSCPPKIGMKIGMCSLANDHHLVHAEAPTEHPGVIFTPWAMPCALGLGAILLGGRVARATTTTLKMPIFNSMLSYRIIH